MRSLRHTLIAAGLALAVLCKPHPAHAEEETQPPPFAPGERLTYEVSWSVFTAGRVVATLSKASEPDRDAYEVKALARSQGFVSALFKVNNEFRSLFDPKTVCSHQISKIINEGRRHKSIQIVFDSARRLAVLDERDLANPKAPSKHAENDVPECVQDVLTAFYFVRRQPLQVGQRLVVPINDGSKTREVVVEVQARERVRSPWGKQVAFRLEPKVFGGVLYRRKGRMLVWLSDDDRRLPLRIKGSVSVGAVTGTLKSVTTDTPSPLPTASQ